MDGAVEAAMEASATLRRGMQKSFSAADIAALEAVMLEPIAVQPLAAKQPPAANRQLPPAARRQICSRSVAASEVKHEEVVTPGSDEDTEASESPNGRKRTYSYAIQSNTIVWTLFEVPCLMFYFDMNVPLRYIVPVWRVHAPMMFICY